MMKCPDIGQRKMKKLFCVFVVLFSVSPAFAAGESLDKTAVIATVSYVDGAYNAVDTSKQNKLTSTNVVESGSGAMVRSVTANNGTVTVDKGEVQIPVGSATGASSHLPIWFE